MSHFSSMQRDVYEHTHNWTLKSDTPNERGTMRRQVWVCASCPETRAEKLPIQQQPEIQMGDSVQAGGFTGTVAGIFPPDNEIEVMVWIPCQVECWDGTHVAACWGEVKHTHAGRYERKSFPADQVKLIAEPIQ